MSDHAGGESSTLLNAALTATHDGIAGYWNGQPGVPVAQSLGTVDGVITYLRMSTRALMLDHELAAAVHVAGADGQATLSQVDAAASGKLPLTGLLTLTRPEPAVFHAQLNWMRSYADLRDDRIAEINVQIDDILSFYGAIALIDNQRRLRTLELLEATVRLCIHAEMKLKHLCRAPRPIDLAPEVQPIVQTPDHSTFPSGHATEAFAVATVLHRLMTGAGPKAGIGKDADGLQTHRAQVFRLANRIAANRTVAGVHFPVDTAAGALLGCIIGDMVYGLGTEQKPKQERAFTAVVGDGGALPAQFLGTHDFDLTWLEAALPDDRKSVKPVAQGTILQEFWRMAKAEWPE